MLVGKVRERVWAVDKKKLVKDEAITSKFRRVGEAWRETSRDDKSRREEDKWAQAIGGLLRARPMGYRRLVEIESV